MSDEKSTWIISRIPKEERDQIERERKESPTKTREKALALIADRLGEAKSWDQKSNNAFVHHSLPVYSSFMMAFEKRMKQIQGNLSATITECSCDICQKGKEGKCSVAGRSVIIEGGIFENTMTLTEWIMNFFQQSPSINALARENQVEIAKAGYSQVAMMGHQMTPTQIDMNKEE